MLLDDYNKTKIYPEKVVLSYLERYVSSEQEFKTNGKGHWVNVPSPFYPDQRKRLGYNLDTGVVFDFKLQQGMGFENFIVKHNKEVLSNPLFGKNDAIKILMDIAKDLRRNGWKLGAYTTQSVRIEEEGGIKLPALVDIPVGLESFNKENIMRNRIGRKALIYLQKREFTPALIDKYGLKYIDHELCPVCNGDRFVSEGVKCGYCNGWGKNKFHGRIFVPTYENGNLVYFQARDYIGRDSKWKYMNPKVPRKQVVYFYDHLPEDERLFGGEGPFDAMYLDEYPCTALMGNKASKAFVQKILWKRPKQFIFIPDFDNKMKTRKQILENLTYNINKFKEETPYSIDIGVYNWFKLTNAKDLNAGGINYVDESLLIFPHKEKFKYKEMIREVLSRPE